jgi:hypothetical protein
MADLSEIRRELENWQKEVTLTQSERFIRAMFYCLLKELGAPEDAPFDWDTVKPGMAFLPSNGGNTHWYVGVNIDGIRVFDIGAGVLSSRYQEWGQPENPTMGLIREPKHDRLNHG